MTWFSLNSCYGALTSFFISLSVNSITRNIWLNRLRKGLACFFTFILRSLTLSEKVPTSFYYISPPISLDIKSKSYDWSARLIYSSKAVGKMISYNFVVKIFCGMPLNFFRILISLRVFLAMYGSSNTFFISFMATSYFVFLFKALITKPYVPCPTFPIILYSFCTYWNSGSMFGFDSIYWSINN